MKRGRRRAVAGCVEAQRFFALGGKWKARVRSLRRSKSSAWLPPVNWIGSLGWAGGPASCSTVTCGLTVLAVRMPEASASPMPARTCRLSDGVPADRATARTAQARFRWAALGSWLARWAATGTCPLSTGQRRERSSAAIAVEVKPRSFRPSDETGDANSRLPVRCASGCRGAPCKSATISA